VGDLPENEDTTDALNGWIEFSADLEFLDYIVGEPIEIESAPTLNLYPVVGISLPTADIIELESEAILEYISWAATEDISEEPFPIIITSTARLEYHALGISGEEAEPIVSQAVLKYVAPSGFISIGVIQLTSEAVLRYISPVRLTFGAPAALTIASEALVKYIHAGILALEEIVPGYQIASTALLHYYHPSGLTVVPSTAAIQIQSKATLWYVREDGITFSVITEPTILEIESQPTLMYGGLTETLLRIISFVGGISIESGALLYYYSKATFDTIIPLPFLFASDALLELYGENTLILPQWAIGEIDSDPILIYDPGEGGIIETELAETWVITTQSWHPSMYSNWGFNSYIEVDGQYYGAKGDGIYLLEGQNDEGSLIRPGVRLFTNLGEHGLKRIRKVLAENCGVMTRLRVTEPVDNTYADLSLERRIFKGNRRIMGRDFVLDFMDFDELGHLKVTEGTMVRDGRKG